MTAGVKSTSAASKIDSTRERELYRYYQPSESTAERNEPLAKTTLSVDAATSPDTTLTALAQLCALRLHASRAMISVIGKQTQYFLAESTKTLDLLDNQKSEVEGDRLWVGCGEVDKEGRLCEKTIELPHMPSGFPCFMVTDLSLDNRFNQLPFVTGPPYFKYYAGTPLTTNKGINIGSLFILDNVVRPPLTADQQSFLGSVAQIIMKHMEMFREAKERKKAMRMSRGLNAFMEGKSHLINEESLPGSSYMGHREEPMNGQINPASSSPSGRRRRARKQDGLTSDENSRQSKNASQVPSSLTDESNNIPATGSAHSHGVAFSRDAKLSTDQDTSQSESDVDISKENVEGGHKTTMARAADLLRQSLDLHSGGGVVYFDTTLGFSSRAEEVPTSPTMRDTAVKVGFEHEILKAVKQSSLILNSTAFRDDSVDGISEVQKSEKLADIISFSMNRHIMSSQDEAQGLASFNPLGEGSLQYLVKRYPRGNIWSFDEDGSLSSSEEDNEKTTSSLRHARIQRRHYIASMLLKHFPGVRQLLFAPLWDSGASRWFAGCFVFNTSREQVFSRETELNFLTAFNNSVMAEVARLASIAADRQKGDFIGSISHEFRSPLHGILASADFLSDTESDAFQTSLVDTILSCGRTLLDTINHILDFSKINTFERNWRNARKAGSRSKGVEASARSLRKEAPPLMNIYAITNVAAVAEEVIEGVYAGQIYQDISSSDISDISAGSRHKKVERSTINTLGSSIGKSDVEISTMKEIEVVLDIAHEDFTFSTQTGAFRRIVMNVFGNALKYTTKGTIAVTLALRDMDHPIDGDPAAKMLEFKVEDTGKGISSEYLRTKLYTPFCQEDVLASGTGLGLSIVRSIVNMLGGSIGIRSEVGKGTEVTIRLPLMRVSATDSSDSTPTMVASTEGLQDDSVTALQAEYPNKTVALYGVTNGTKTGEVLKQYITNWFGLEIISDSSTPLSADIILVDVKQFPSLLNTEFVAASVIVLCDNSTRYSRKASLANGAIAVEFVSKPYGPYKLAKALRLCLDKAKDISSVLRPTVAVPEQSPMITNARTIDPGLQALTPESENAFARAFMQMNIQAAAPERMAFSRQSTAPENKRPAMAGEAVPFPARGKETQEINGHNNNGLDRANLTKLKARRPNLMRRATEPSRFTSLIEIPVSPFPLLATTKEGITVETLDPAYSGVTTPRVAVYPQEKRLVSPFPTPVTIKEGITVETPDHAHPGITSCTVAVEPQKKRPPRILVVDDNSINLRLLQTYTRKRKYKLVDSAVNGQLALEAAKRHPEGYDIIFMDISMPVMNGFEATRAIREFECDCGRVRGTQERVLPLPGGQQSAPAFIIALTGLASGRDQTEAFASGVDMYLTKPVSFKEVGRVLDNWEANGGIGLELEEGV